MPTGSLDAALEVVNNIDKAVPGLALLKLRQISIQRRRCNFDDVTQLYELCITDCEEKLQERTFYSIKYARYLAKVGVKLWIIIVTKIFARNPVTLGFGIFFAEE